MKVENYLINMNKVLHFILVLHQTSQILLLFKLSFVIYFLKKLLKKSVFQNHGGKLFPLVWTYIKSINKENYL